ncbi:hypothetical protein OUZ56_009002 [Daphnia magna]|uniref:Uncharacterized protein n=1 Tax=Daphnia magna TaxID=35525 RepID=A0ABR0AEP6_9CRUS|nr:hypothetical protein OUZ56_009002 [Daphnia magna]
METPVEGERNDVRIELIEAEPAEFIPPEYSSGALYSRIGRPDKLDNGVVFWKRSEVRLPPPPPACQLPPSTCKPATEPPSGDSFPPLKSNTLRPFTLLIPIRHNRIDRALARQRRTAVV